MKFLIFTFYILSVLPIIFLQAMEEKKINIFQPKSLQEICIKPTYAFKPTSNDQENQINAFFSTESINTLNKKLPLTIYPIIAYHILKREKIIARDKYAIITFLRDFPEKHEKKTKKILNFFIEFIETNNYYHSTLLAVAIHPSVKPWTVKFLLESGEIPYASLVWQLIGNEKARPEIHRYNIKKLAHILKYNVPLEPRPHNPFIPSSDLTPLEYVQNMLICWKDETWTKGYKEKPFSEFFRPKLCESQSEETINKYKTFFNEVVDLLTTYNAKT